jgi:hypothetical protein
MMNREASYALPAQCYGDPSDVVERRQLNDLGCLACGKHSHLFGKVVCTEPSKTSYKDVPRVGSKCKYFELKG